MSIKQDEYRKKWAAIVKEFHNSGLTQSDFSRKNKLNSKQLSCWIKRFKHSKLPNQQPTQEWVMIKSQAPQEIERILPNALNIKIGCVTIEVQDGFNSNLLVQVIDTLRSIC